MPLEGRTGVRAQLVHAIQDVLTQEMRRVPGYRVITMADVEQMLSQEQRAQLVGCSTESCLAEIAGALQAEELVYGAVGRLGDDELVLSLNRVEPRTATALGGESERLNGRDNDAMLDGVPRLIKRLYTDYAPPPPRVQPMRAWMLGLALSVLGVMLQYGMFSSIFTCSFLLLPFTPVLVVGMLLSTVACALTPAFNSWQQAWIADVMGRRQAGTRWAMVAGFAVLGLSALVAPGAGVMVALPFAIAGGGLAVLDGQSRLTLREAVLPTSWVALMTSGSATVIAFMMAVTGVLALGTLIAPVVQSAIILGMSTVRPETVASETPRLYSRHEPVPGILRWIPSWLIGGEQQQQAEIDAP